MVKRSIVWQVCYCLPGMCYSTLSEDFGTEQAANARAETWQRQHPEYQVWVRYESRYVK